MSVRFRGLRFDWHVIGWDGVLTLHWWVTASAREIDLGDFYEIVNRFTRMLDATPEGATLSLALSEYVCDGSVVGTQEKTRERLLILERFCDACAARGKRDSAGV